MNAFPFVSSNLGPDERVILGEGPIFFGDRLLTTDARRSLIRSTDPLTGVTQNIDLAKLLRAQNLIPADAANPVLGCIASTEDGRLLAAMATGIYLVDLQTSTMSEFSHPEAERVVCGPHYNDGKVGPDGAFYVGGMIGGEFGAGRLLRIAGDGSYSEPLVGAPPLTTPNGMHWFATEDPNVWDFFYVCSQYPAIQRYRHDLGAGKMTRQDDLISLPNEEFGFLDGMTGTDDALLILALYMPVEYGCIVIDTQTGKIIERISTGVPQTTSVAIREHTLFITSAAQEYTATDYEKFPFAGSILRGFLEQADASQLREAREDTVASGWQFSFTAC
jgi:sugar lactone lactonase YvrE